MLRDDIYKTLQEQLSHSTEVGIHDITEQSCTYRNYLRLTMAETVAPESGQRILVREVAKGIRAKVRKYLVRAFPAGREGSTFQPGPKMSHNGVVFDVVGFLDDALVEVVVVDEATYKNSFIPNKVRAAVAYQANFFGKKKAHLIVVNQNVLDWESWELTGDFSKVSEEIEAEIGWLSSLLDGKGSHFGTASPTTCRSCPFRRACKADKIDDPDPWDTKKIILRRVPKLTEDLDNYLDEYSNGEGRRKPQKRISPSHFSITKCDRAIAYRLMGTQEKGHIIPKTQRIFDTGHIIHDVIQQTLAHIYGDRFLEEVSVSYPEIYLRGSADGVIDGRIGTEFKSISWKGFEKLTAAKTEHKKQLNMYSVSSGLEEELYLYYNKDDGDIVEFLGTPDIKLWEKQRTRAKSIVAQVEDDKMPDRIDAGWACGECRFAWLCRPGELATKNRSTQQAGRNPIRQRFKR
jgi:CRISPR/Cas system-associated exonuclease Cas4 (RecB family)